MIYVVNLLYNSGTGSGKMKKIFVFIFAIFIGVHCADAYTKVSENEIGVADAKNQNIVVKCTTPTGQISEQTCALRRYAKCADNKCVGWNRWRDLKNTRDTYASWQDAADACCRTMGLR